MLTRPPDRVPVPDPQATTTHVDPAPAPILDSPQPVSEVPPPPPAARRQSREQLNTKIRVDLRSRLNAFVNDHDSTVQGVLEAALDEYMTRRGWSWDDYRRTSKSR